MRTKKLGAVEEEINATAKSIMQDFSQFTSGVRYLSLLHRTKDGGYNKEYHRRGGFYVTHTEEEYLDALVRLLTLQAIASKPYRLYASVNQRSISKAEKQFKMEMLEADFSSAENKHYFYERIESRWSGCLMKPGSRIGSLFILDVDGEGDCTAPVLQELSKLVVEPVKMYKTPNGWHIITPPFNPELLNVTNCEVKKDGLILLNY